MGVINDTYPTRGRNFKHGIGFQNRCSVRGAMEPLVVFSAPTNLNQILGYELKIQKYHEVVNNAIMDAIVRPFGGEHTPWSCMLTSVARVLHRTHKKWELNKEMEGWMKRGNTAPSSSDGDDDEDEGSGE